jgi:hypothetical protein
MTRIEAARLRLRIARYVIGIGAAASLAAFAAAARVSHPATHHASSPQATSTQPATSDDGFFSGDDDSSASIGPSGSVAPQIQSGGS